MSVELQTRWTNSGSGATQPNCTVSGVSGATLLVAFCAVREDVTTITKLQVSSASQTAGWSNGAHSEMNNYSAIAISSKTAEGTTDDNITFTVTGPSDIYAWDVVVYEFNLDTAGATDSANNDTNPDSLWELPNGDWPTSGAAVGVACVFGVSAISETGNTSPAYNRTTNPDGYIWDTTFDNYERTVVSGSTYYYKYSLGYAIVTSPATPNKPDSDMSYAGNNIDGTVYLLATGTDIPQNVGGMLMFNF